MTTVLLVAFLVAHGLIHLAIWLPHPEPDPDKPPPFQPDHSALLTVAAVPQTEARLASMALAVAAGAAYLLAGLAVALEAGWAAPVAVAAALAGLALKVLFFSRWLSVGILLDAAVLSAALTGWPVALG